MPAPVVSIEAVDSVFDNRNLAGPVAVIYCARWSNGTAREIYVPGDPTHPRFDQARFLRDGRSGNHVNDVKKLLIEDDAGMMSAAVRDALREADNEAIVGTGVPVRAVECVDDVFWGKGLMDGPVAGIYRAEFMDGTRRELLVEGDALHRNFNTVFFLRAGRRGDQLGQIRDLVIHGRAGVVPDTLKDALRRFEAGRNDPAAKLKLG